MKVSEQITYLQSGRIKKKTLPVTQMTVEQNMKYITIN